MPLVYQELRKLAQRHAGKQRSGGTLQTTALLHEAYLKLLDYPVVDWHDRAHFFAFAASVMRSILVDRARHHASAKRGGGVARVELDEAAVVSPGDGSPLLELHQALERLTAIDARKGRIVELRHFGGLSVEETAEVMGLAPITIKREWLRAKAWLHRELNSEKSGA